MGDDYNNGNRRGLHIGVIPDGNRRYARKKGWPDWRGHWDGAKKIKQFTDWCREHQEIKKISVFALSTENLKRSKKELDELWRVYESHFRDILVDPSIKENGVKVNILGNEWLWKPHLKTVIGEVINSTKNYTQNVMNIMLAYGSKYEMTQAVRKAARKPLVAMERFLLVKEPLDLIIRTGGQRRLSNFMLYQASYAEIYFSDTLWPEFSRKEFDKIIKWYYTQQKKFGR